MLFVFHNGAAFVHGVKLEDGVRDVLDDGLRLAQTSGVPGEILGLKR